MKRKDKGFTLMELLVVIAIIAVLAVVAIPTLTSQMEKSREAADLANVRAAYAQVSTEAILGNTEAAVTVPLKQRRADWQSVDPVNIGGIVHARGQGDTENWKGVAEPGGSCAVSYDESCGVVLTWSGAAAPSKPSYPFDTGETNFFDVLYRTAFWTDGTIRLNQSFEFDSRCPDSEYIPAIQQEIDKLSNSLLQQEDCTWAYLGFKRKNDAEQQKSCYLLWTSLDTDRVGSGEKIPVLIQTGEGKYYVSETTTEQRWRNKQKYVTVSERMADYKALLKPDAEYATLAEAYDAYVAALNDARYDGVRAKAGR